GPEAAVTAKVTRPDTPACPALRRAAAITSASRSKTSTVTRVGLRYRDAGPAGAACQVGHPGGWLAAQLPVHVRDGGQPPCSQQVQERGPVVLCQRSC